MTEKKYRPGLPPPPPRIARLPVDPERGYPIPAFVSWQDGKPLFPVIDQTFWGRCMVQGVCWVCGEILGSNRAFVIGPRGAVQRLTAEPPNHYDCANYAVRACPFMVNPRMKRNPGNYGDGVLMEPTVHTDLNPGIMAVWVQRGRYPAFRPYEGANVMLIRLGDPDRVEWWAGGAPATRAEVVAALNVALDDLRPRAIAGGTEAARRLEEEVRVVTRFLPVDNAPAA